ncbi:branched-chain amino acid ABC transporter permease [Castellaniella sp. UC4442_H9]|jgi:branched-chain amino acid transport system permease protein|nr:branched-chain amino acid ABC transporter permease [Castellaniella sp.]
MNQIPAVLADGIIYASWLFLIAAGLTLIYGVMKILNMAHGSLYALGAYAAASLGGVWLAHGYSPYGSYAILIVAAVVAGLAAGLVIERGLLRFMYGRDEVTLLLATYALLLILEDLIKLAWGVDPYFFAEPYGLLGTLEFGNLIYPTYDLLLLAVALLIGGAMSWVLKRTRSGKLLRVVIHDREVSVAMGINVGRFYLTTFTVGAILAAIGGAITAPMISVVPGMGVEVIVLAFAVVVIGGLGSLPGAALGALIVGITRAAAVHYLPEAELFSVYLVMAIVLIFRPKGLFAGAEVRKI